MGIYVIFRNILRNLWYLYNVLEKIYNMVFDVYIVGSYLNFWCKNYFVYDKKCVDMFDINCIINGNYV